MTDGRYALSAVCGINTNPTPEELKRIRKEEVIRSAEIMGVSKQNLIFFNFEDGSLWQGRAEAEEKVEEILKRQLPQEIYFPSQKDYHADHWAANRIVLDSIEKVGSSALRYQYSIVQKYSNIGPLVDRLLNILKRNLIAVDISESLLLKGTAIKEFRSQISIISETQKRPVLMKIGKHLKNKEMFYIK